MHIPAKDNPASESIEADLKFVYTQLEQKKTYLMEKSNGKLKIHLIMPQTMYYRRVRPKWPNSIF